MLIPIGWRGASFCRRKKTTFPLTQLKIQKAKTQPFLDQFLKNKNLCDPYKMQIDKIW